MHASRPARGAANVIGRLRSLRTERQFVLALSTVGGAAFAVSVTAAIKDLAVAARFGASDQLDAFLLALGVYILVTNMFTTALSDAFLPAFVGGHERLGYGAGRRLLRLATTLNVVILAGLCCVLALASPFIFAVLAGSFDAAKRALTQSLFLALIPALLLGGFGAAWAPVLNARGQFRVAAISPLLTPLLTLCLLLAWGPNTPIWLLAIGVVCGKALELASMGWRLYGLGYSLLPGWGPGGEVFAALGRILHQAAPLAVAGLLATGSLVIDQAIAATLGSGAVSLLSYGTRVTVAVVGIGSLALSSVLFPEFSRLFASGDVVRLRQTATHYAVLAFTAASGVAILLLVISEPLIRVLFERGAFTAADTAIAARIQTFFVLQIPFHVAGMVLVRLLSALRRNHVLMLFGVVMVATNALGDVILKQFFGVAGIALSTSLVFVVSFLLLCVGAEHAVRDLERARA